MDTSLRCITLLRVSVGGACAVFPGRLASVAEGHPAASLSRLLARVLGVRQLVQAVLTITAPELITPLRSAAIDGLHAATMALLASASRRHRRAALVNTALAVTFCAVDVARAGNQRGGRAVGTAPATVHETLSWTAAPQPGHSPEEGNTSRATAAGRTPPCGSLPGTSTRYQPVQPWPRR